MSNYRKEIAKIDDKIVDLLIKRFELTDEVGRFKKKNNIPVENKEVEEKVLFRINEKLKSHPSKDSILNLYAGIFSESKDRQRKI